MTRCLMAWVYSLPEIGAILVQLSDYRCRDRIHDPGSIHRLSFKQKWLITCLFKPWLNRDTFHGQIREIDRQRACPHTHAYLCARGTQAMLQQFVPCE